MFHRFHQFSVVSSEIANDLSLFLENGVDGIDGVARLELLGERMVDQAGSRLVLVVLESSVEEVLERGRLIHFWDESALAKEKGVVRGVKTNGG